jgi:hypothetical protein
VADFPLIVRVRCGRSRSLNDALRSEWPSRKERFGAGFSQTALPFAEDAAGISKRRWIRRNSGQVDNLAGLRSRNHSLKVCVFALAGPFLTFGSALDATLLLLLYFLFAGTFSLAFIHPFCLRASTTFSALIRTAT